MKKILSKVFVFFFIALLGLTLVACKKTFKVSFDKKDQVKLVGDSKDVDLTKVKEGTTISFTVENVDGKDTVVKIDGKVQKAEKGVYKITVNADTSVVIENNDKEPESTEVDKKALNEAITNATALKDKAVEVEELPEAKDLEKDKVNAKKEDLDALNTAIQAAQKVVDNKEATKEEVEKAVKDLNTAVETFKKAAVVGTKEVVVSEEVDKKALNEAIANATTLKNEAVEVEELPEAKDLEKGKVNAKKEDLDALNTAIQTAQEVVDNKEATKEDVDKAVDALNVAVEAFNNAKVTGTKEVVPVVNKEALKKAITDAKNAKEGVTPQEEAPVAEEIEKDKKAVKQSDLDTFNTAIEQADTIVKKAEATQEEVNKAVEALNAAIEAFNEAVVVGTKE